MHRINSEEAANLLSQLTGNVYAKNKIQLLVKAGKLKPVKQLVRGNWQNMFTRTQIVQVAKYVSCKPYRNNKEDGKDVYAPSEEEIYKLAAELRAKRDKRITEERCQPVEIRVVPSPYIGHFRAG